VQARRRTAPNAGKMPGERLVVARPHIQGSQTPGAGSPGWSKGIALARLRLFDTGAGQFGAIFAPDGAVSLGSLARGSCATVCRADLGP
jgi:hypothetical protein